MAEDRKRAWAGATAMLSIALGVIALVLGGPQLPAVTGIACGVLAIVLLRGGSRAAS